MGYLADRLLAKQEDERWRQQQAHETKEQQVWNDLPELPADRLDDLIERLPYPPATLVAVLNEIYGKRIECSPEFVKLIDSFEVIDDYESRYNDWWSLTQYQLLRYISQAKEEVRSIKAMSAFIRLLEKRALP